MKKIYLKPEVQNTMINSEWAMCTQGGTTGNNPTPGNPGDPLGGAPGRVF